MSSRRSKCSRLEAAVLEKEKPVKDKEERLNLLERHVQRGMKDLKKGIRPKRRFLPDVDSQDVHPAQQPSNNLPFRFSPPQLKRRPEQEMNIDSAAAPEDPQVPMTQPPREERLSETMTPKVKKVRR